MWFCWTLLAVLLVSAEGLKGYDNSGDPFSSVQSIIPERGTRSAVFWTGSRYNRRGENMRSLDLKPRADRFFMGSRYGKRAHPPDENETAARVLCKIVNFLDLCSRYAL